MEADMLQTWPQFHEDVLKRFPPGNMAEQPGDLINERAQLLQQMDLPIAGQKIAATFLGRQAPLLFHGLAEWLKIPAENLDSGGLRALAPALARLSIADFYHAMEAATAVQGKFSALGKTATILAQFQAEIGMKREELLATLEAICASRQGIPPGCSSTTATARTPSS